MTSPDAASTPEMEETRGAHQIFIATESSPDLCPRPVQRSRVN